MKRLFLFGLIVGLFLSQSTQADGQDNDSLNVSQAWGIVFGSSESAGDFLIYDACRPDFDSSLIFVAGKSRKENAFELKQGDKAYFHAKDSNTDAFLACFSTRGQLLWSTYLPNPDNEYLNGFASCVRAVGNTVWVVVNAYQVRSSIERTRNEIPLASGNFRIFEFDRNGTLLRAGNFYPRYRQDGFPVSRSYPYVPRIFDMEKADARTVTLSGHVLASRAEPNGAHGASHSCRFTLGLDWSEDQLTGTGGNTTGFSNRITHWLAPDQAFLVTFSRDVTWTQHMICHLSSSGAYKEKALGMPEAPNTPQKAPGGMEQAPSAGFSFAQGHNLRGRPLFAETWKINSRTRNREDYFYGEPASTIRYEGMDGDYYTGAETSFPGSVQNTRDVQEYILVQGIHADHYANGYFKSEDTGTFLYSHAPAETFPATPGKFGKRNPDHVAAPFLLLYKRATFNDNPMPGPDWGGFLDVDWLYNDLFSCIDLSNPRNYYEPSAPVLLSSGSRFFIIGNARTIGESNLCGHFPNEGVKPEAHHQGFMAAFQLGCPPALARFIAPETLCPDDSVKLELPAEYENFLFAFDSTVLNEGSIVVSPDSLHAWAKKPGRFHARMISRMEGCPDARTDTVEVTDPGMHKPGNLFLPRDTILCAHLDLDLVLPPQADDYHCFWLDKDSILLPFGNDTTRFSIQGMRGADGFGQNTDTRQPRFFQLALLHMHCPLAFLDSLRVFDLVRPAMTLPFHDTVVCLDIPVRLDSLNPLVYRPFYDFRWNDGKQGSDFEFSRSGTFSLAFFVRDDFNLCRYDSAFDSVHVLRSDPALTRISLPEDTAFCKKRSITLDASLPFPSTRYCWQEGSLEDLMPDLPDSLPFSSPRLHLQSDQEADFLYGLFLLDSLGCLNARQVAVKAQDCSPALHVPNVFTPNGDGVNDLLRFTQLEHCFDLDILIVDRKGATVLKQKIHDPDHFAWNGCFMNRTKKLPDGPYFYFISFRDAYGKKKQQSGTVTILGSNE